jgi:PAS domain S-box-containing protein
MMTEKSSLFHNEEEVLKTATQRLEQVDESETPLYEDYQKLLKEYKKLLKQTKILVKMNDRQQNHLTTLKEGLQSNNIKLQHQAQEAEEAVRASETRLAQFLDAVPVGIFVVNAQGKPYYTNQKARTILGRDISQLTTTRQLLEAYRVYLAGTRQLYPKERHPIFQALKGYTSNIDDVEIHRGDQVLPLEVWGTPIFEKGQIAYAMVAFQEITERKQAEQEKLLFTQKLSQLNQAYERFVPRQFLNLLEKQSVIDINLGDQVEKEMTILFSDIRDFTALSEHMTPQDNFEFINAYLGQMEPIIHQHTGFIDKYVGDAIMALFPNRADDAVKAAIEMLNTLHKYNKILRKTQIQPIKIGIGLNTGLLMLGTVGGQNRMDGTVIADAVNVASRLEGLTKLYGTALLITEHTYQNLTQVSDYHIRMIDQVTVKGKTEPITIYEVFDADSPEMIEKKIMTLNVFETGFTYFHNGQFELALDCFQQVIQENQCDQVAQVYLKYCQNVLNLMMPVKPTILVVDDIQVNSKLLTAVLAKKFTVIVANNGEKALEMAQTQSPHLILLDIMMPGIDGFETCRQLKTNHCTQDIPIIFMTALTDIGDKVKGFELGAVDYITKPFQRQEVLARIKTHLNMSFLQKKLQAQQAELEINSYQIKQKIKNLILQSSFELPHE